VVDLSAFYFDVLKDRLYISAPNAPGRRAAQTAIWRIGEELVRLLAPITSFTCDEVWRHLPKMPAREESVHLALFSEGDGGLAGETGSGTKQEGPKEVDQEWTSLRAVRDAVLKALEEARNSKQIAGSLEAQVTVTAAEPVFSLLTRHQDWLRYLFIVSAVTVEKGAAGNGSGGISVQVRKADGRKCERCWNYSLHVGEDAAYPTVCERCSAVLKEIGG
jgi:isoleucyl-tRNA synthetase